MSISKFNIIRNNIIHCIFCNKDFKSLGFSTHVLVKHNMHSKEYYDRYLITKDENICNYCKNPTKFINCTYGYRRYCSSICARKSEETRQSMSDTWKSHDEQWKHNILNKCSETYYNKTGYKHNWSNPECRQKCINTYYDKTGYYHNMKNPEHIKARQELYLQKTGYKHNWSNPELRKQSADKLYEKTGYKHYMQNPATQIHSMHGFYVNDIWFDSKWEYELYYALNKSSNQFIYHPAIVFTYIKNQVEHTYHPDFLINNKIYEVKGDFFFNENKQLYNPFTKELELEKQQCMLDNHVIILCRHELDMLIADINSGIII